ncbi:hypothetical protein [Nocardioides sp. Leaf285]|uniref:hypothetical protein n=1 Tax=Nocardioides sp. Leaf285 TaxID=1736322 RepID=UPI0007030C74|nr:hypothetical protein [Nocardioides sp. Leaf285]KQP63132.1 hypothetical protein ASF47_19170 [Nocardioides sp. Leaf285]
MSTPSFDAAQHPRSGDGTFARKPLAESTGVNLSPDPAPAGTTAPPMTPRDVETLSANRGVFAEGYTPEDAASVLSRFESADLRVFWDYADGDGLGGDSFFAGFARASRASGPYGVGRAVPYEAPFSQYAHISDQAWEYLSDPDCDLDPEAIPSLLGNEHAAINVGEIYSHDVGASTQYSFANHLDDEGEERCREDGCDKDPDSGDGWDGYCGIHADLIERHDAGEHDGDNARPADCPICVSP